MSFGSGTQFIALLPPPGTTLKDYDNTRRHTAQPPSIPEVFLHAMAVREEVFTDEQKTPLDIELDSDDARSWHWVVYASVANSSTAPSPSTIRADGPVSKAEEERRASATASRVPIGTIRLVPPPHPPNPYKKHDSHPDADPPPEIEKHPDEPFIKLGRMAVLKPYRSLGLGRLLVNTALEWASQNARSVCPPADPAAVEAAKVEGKDSPEALGDWKGLCMVHAQVAAERFYARNGFSEELRDEKGDVEIGKETRWWEEGIEHLGMWRRIKVDGDNGRL